MAGTVIHRKRRKLKSEINVVPYIDVMLVLLIIFMVTAPLLTLSVDVKLPSMNARSTQDQQDPVIVVAYADGRLYCRNEGGRGTLFLVEANPQRYIEHGRFDPPGRSGLQAWPHPIIANGKLYIRDQDALLCYDVKEK